MMRPIVLLACFVISPLYSYKVPDISTLSLEEKIGQLIIAAAVSYNEPTEFSKNSPYTMDKSHVTELITKHHIGGIIFLGMGNTQEQIECTQQFQALAQIPLLIAQDLEWGLTMRLNPAIRFPRAMTLGALDAKNDMLMYEMAREIGKQCNALGVHMNLAPVVDVNNNPKNPVINDRSFGQCPMRVADKAILYMKGMQQEGIITCAKHFPGHGDTETDSHYSLATIKHSRSRFDAIELLPFKRLIQEGVDAVMIAHLHIPAFDPILPATLSRAIVHDLLKKELGFHGLVITDGLGMRALTDHYAPGEIAVKALQAGCDILLCPVDVPQAIESIKNAIQSGLLSEKDLNEKVEKILALKAKVINDHLPLDLCNDNAKALKKKLYQAAITRIGTTYSSTQPNKVLLVSIGTEQETVLSKTLKQYRDIDEIYLPQHPTLHDIHHLADNTEFHKVIVAVHGMNRSAINAFGMNSAYTTGYGIRSSTIELVNELLKNGKEVTTVLFGNPYSAAYFPKNQEILIAFEDDVDTQEGVGLILSGIKQASGILPVVI